MNLAAEKGTNRFNKQNLNYKYLVRFSGKKGKQTCITDKEIEDKIVHRSYTNNLSSCEIKA